MRSASYGVGRRLGVVRIVPEAIVDLLRHGTAATVSEGLPVDAVFVRSWIDESTGMLCFEFEHDSFPVVLPGQGPKDVRVTSRSDLTDADRLRLDVLTVRRGRSLRMIGLPAGVLT